LLLVVYRLSFLKRIPAHFSSNDITTGRLGIFMNSMMKSTLVLATVFLGLVGTMGASGGATLMGQIGMMGKATLDAPLATATTITGFSRARVGYGSGDYDVPGEVGLNTPVVFTPLVFKEALSEPVVLWEFTSAGKVYSFELHEVDFECFELAENSFMNMSGRGFAYVDGLRRTAAEFCFSTQQCTDSDELVVTWSAETIVAPVPEGGASLVFLLFGIVGIELFRKRVQNRTIAWG